MNRALPVLFLAVALLASCARDIEPTSGVAEARALAIEGKNGEARILLKNLLSRHPQTVAARVLLAQIALDEGDAQAASDEISTLGEGALADPEALKIRIRIDIENGKPDEALQRLKKSGAIIPQPDRALLFASAQRALGSPGEALTVLRELQGAQASSEPVVLGIAETLAAMGNFEQATAELDRYLSASPAGRADALRMRGEVKLRQGIPDAAAADFEAALQAAPPGWPRVIRITTELMVADALVAAGQINAAKLQVAKVEKESPGTLGAMVLQGQIALLEGRPDEAVEHLEAVDKAGAGNDHIQYLLIEALMKTGNVARATELLEQLVATEPDTSPSRRVLATLFMAQGRPDRVIQILGADAEAGVSEEATADDDLLVAARLARERAAVAISSLSARLAATPTDTNLRNELAAAQLANGEPAAALDTLGPFVEGKQDPVAVGIRIFAFYANGNEMPANSLVDRLLNTTAGADLPVLLAAADAASRQQQYSTVSRLLERAAKLAPGNPEIAMRQANLAFANRKFDDANKILNELLRRDPGNTAVQLALARVAESQGDVNGSRAALAAAVRDKPAAIEPSLMLASLELRASKGEDASKVLDALVAANKDANAANAAGLLLARAGRYEEARTRFRQALDREPDNPDYWFNLGEAQLAMKDAAAARQSFLRSATLRPDSLRAATYAVRLSIEQKDSATAKRVAEALVAKLPASPVAWLVLGEAQAASGDLAGAATSFSRSYVARPTSLAAKREFAARVASGMQRPEEPLLKWLAREPKDTAARLVLANYYLVNAREDRALEHLEAIVKQTPNDIAALNNLAWILRNSDSSRAESLARRGHAIAPDNAAVADTLGVILLNNGKTAEAVQLLAQAAAGLPDDRSVLFHYAKSLAKTGQKEKARDVLGKTLQDQRAFPDRDAAKRLLEELG